MGCPGGGFRPPPFCRAVTVQLGPGAVCRPARIRRHGCEGRRGHGPRPVPGRSGQDEPGVRGVPTRSSSQWAATGGPVAVGRRGAWASWVAAPRLATHLNSHNSLRRATTPSLALWLRTSPVPLFSPRSIRVGRRPNGEQARPGEASGGEPKAVATSQDPEIRTGRVMARLYANENFPRPVVRSQAATGAWHRGQSLFFCRHSGRVSLISGTAARTPAWNGTQSRGRQRPVGRVSWPFTALFRWPDSPNAWRNTTTADTSAMPLER